jgi:15-cis-phytoene synthase
MTASNEYYESYVSSGSDEYYSLCFASKPQKAALMALYAFYDEIVKIPKKCQEASVAEAKLNWWQLEVDAMYHDAPQHPITKTLQAVLKETHLSRTYFYSLISGVQLQLNFEQYSTFDDLIADAQNLKAPLFGLMFEVMRAKKEKPQVSETEKSSQAIAEFAVYMRIFDIIVSLKSDLLHNKLFLPEQDLLDVNLDMAQLFQFNMTEPLFNLLKNLKVRAQYHLKTGLSLLGQDDYPLMQPMLILMGLMAERFELLEEEKYPVFKHQIQLTPIRKYFLSRKIKNLSAKRKEKALSRLFLGSM